MKNRTRIGLALVTLAVFAGILFVAWNRERPAPRSAVPAVVVHEEDGLRFTYHVPTATEGLFDLKSDPRMLKNLGPERPADVKRLRAALTKKLEVESLEELQHAHRDLIDRLHALGYF